jgi:hypothetical protein
MWRGLHFAGWQALTPAICGAMIIFAQSSTCAVRRARSTSGAHDALFHPLFEDSYLEPLEAFDGRTLYDQLNHIEPAVEGVFEFHVTLMGQDPDIARAHLNLLLTNLAAASRSVFNMNEAGQICPIEVC